MAIITPTRKPNLFTKTGIRPGLKPDIPKSSKGGLSNVALAKTALSFFSTLGSELRSANQLKNQASQYRTNAYLSDMDKNEALRIGQVNAQIMNVGRFLDKGKKKSAMASSGFVVGGGDFGDMLKANDEEYYKTMAAIVADSEFRASGLQFEGDKSRIQAEYLRKISRIQSRTAIASGLLSAAATAAGAFTEDGE